jgi:hypothetical protein
LEDLFLKVYLSQTYVLTSLALSSLYPEYPGLVRSFFDHLSQDLTVRSLDGWYNIKTEEVKRRGGSGIISHHDGNLIKALATAYPEHQWMSNIAPKGHWTDINRQKEFFASFAKAYGVHNTEQWMSVRYSDLIAYGGGTLLQYEDSWHKMLSQLYPEYANLQRKFFDNLGQQLNIQSLNEWYEVNPNEVRARGGDVILKHYGGSLVKGKHPSK